MTRCICIREGARHVFLLRGWTMRRPRSGSFAAITTPESQRSADWKARDLSNRPERRRQTDEGENQHHMSVAESIEDLMSAHWLLVSDAREVVGCHCGFRADTDSDCGWGDSVVEHLFRAALEKQSTSRPHLTGPGAP